MKHYLLYLFLLLFLFDIGITLEISLDQSRNEQGEDCNIQGTETSIESVTGVETGTGIETVTGVETEIGVETGTGVESVTGVETETGSILSDGGKIGSQSYLGLSRTEIYSRDDERTRSTNGDSMSSNRGGLTSEEFTMDDSITESTVDEFITDELFTDDSTMTDIISEELTTDDTSDDDSSFHILDDGDWRLAGESRDIEVSKLGDSFWVLLIFFLINRSTMIGMVEHNSKL